ncbi:hypothetical protein MAHJHV57_15770 [Mycobacterium avium subsp. hominissuis]
MRRQTKNSANNTGSFCRPPEAGPSNPPGSQRADGVRIATGRVNQRRRRIRARTEDGFARFDSQMLRQCRRGL